MHSFDEKHPELVGFSKRFSDDVFPVLAAKDGKRRKVIKQIQWAVIGICVLMAALALAGYLLSGNMRHLIHLFIGGGMGIAAIIGFLQKDIKADTKAVLMDAVSAHLGWSYSVDVTINPNLGPMIKHGLLPKRFDRQRHEDEISGEAHGAHFQAVESHLEKRIKNSKGKDQWKTMFRGTILTIDFHRKFLGSTVVLRDKGWFNAKTKNTMKRVGLVDPVFEKIFEAYGTDQVEARYLLTPDFMQRLVDLEHSVDGKNIRFGFFDDKLHIAVETGNRFEAGSMWTSLTDPARTQKILDEAAAIIDVIDGVIKPARKNAPSA